MDITDLVDHNIQLLNRTDLAHSFFCLSKNDPSLGFAFDASNVAGKTYPEQWDASLGKTRLFPYLMLQHAFGLGMSM